MIIFVTRLYKSSSLLKPALYTVVQFSKKFSQISKKFFQNFTHFLGNAPSPTFINFFKNLKIANRYKLQN